jgi:prepilin-type N-terminal cleavage/methylation domain-containing protein
LNFHPTSRRRAFTLIEIMVAVMVFSMVIAAIYATWALVMRASQVGQDAAAQAQRQRVVLRAIGDALMGIESFQASQKYYWFKLENGGTPFLSFVARLPDTYARNGKFVGAAGGRDASSRRVTFSLAAGENGEKDLVLRQNPILMDMDPDEEKYPLVLARNVKNFTIEWWGTNRMNEAEWSTEWDDTLTNTIPQMLRVHLVLGANVAGGSSAPEFSATRIYTVPSQMMPVNVQRGAAGGLGGNGGLPPPVVPPGGNPRPGRPTR